MTQRPSILNSRCTIVLLLFVGAGPATSPSTQPASDPIVDWLISQESTAPTTQASPQSPSTSPFQPRADANARRGTIMLSDGQAIIGSISTTADKPIRVFDRERKEYRDVPFKLIRSARASVLWEREEREWHFKESGSDIKEYTGKTYPAREMQYTLTLMNGQTVAGDVVAPLYVTVDGKETTYVLHKRDKGEVGQTLKDLVYVKSVELEE